MSADYVKGGANSLKWCHHAGCQRAITNKRHGVKYCSAACRKRETFRLRGQRVKARTAEIRTEKKAAGRPCSLPGCKGWIPENYPLQARYCSEECKYQARLDSNRQNYQRNRDTYNANERQKRALYGQPPRPPRKVAPAIPPFKTLTVEGLEIPRPKLPPEARKCFGCRHMRLSPESERGVECSAGVFLRCRPLAPDGPKLKEVM